MAEDGRPQQHVPSVDSDLQEERIQARRNRIAARKAAKNRDPNAEAIKEEQKPKSVLEDPTPYKSVKQIADSRKELDALREEGSQRVTLVRVTADLEESKRRRANDEQKRQRRKKLEQEREEATKLYDQINVKWEEAMSHTQPGDLKQALNKQRDACAEVLKSKDRLIEEFRSELKSRDDDYVRLLRSQGADVDSIIEYMNEQKRTLAREYRTQLEEIEKAFMDERSELLDTARKTWQKGMKDRRDGEVNAIDTHFSRVEENQSALEHVRITDNEEYTSIKIKLEREIEQLEDQLQTMKATYQLNAEKLEYNFQVLKKRDEENTVMVTQQKRKINRLQDVLNNTKAKLKEKEKAFLEENSSLTEKYKRITDQFKELQQKFKHFQTLDVKRYDDVWEMNEEICVDLAQKTLDADKVICEQQLGLQWVPPTERVFDSRANTQEESVMEIIESDARLANGAMSRGTVKRALGLLCDEGGFLVESKLNTLLSPLGGDEQSLMKLDSILKALGVESESEIILLARYFLAPEDNEEEGPPKLIERNRVVASLRAFVEDFRKLKGLDKPTDVLPQGGRKQKKGFWEDLVAVVDPSHDKMWSTLSEKLDEYSQILLDRSTGIDECEALKQQNNELRVLLQQYMSSQVNSELAIPPTMVMAQQAAAAGATLN